MKNFRNNVLLTISFLVTGQLCTARDDPPSKKILIVFEANDIPDSPARGEGRQMAQLLGHFNAAATVRAANDYKPGELETFDFIFVIGF
ncbi:MAG: hypothetical protein AAB393_10010, partial [Bacteroidota bacterium]